jgi:predicted RNase H-like HicB family nuclease
VKQYLIIVEKAGRNYSAYSPDLPGCVATGSTPDETRARMQEAVRLHLRGLGERHLPTPEPSAIAFTVEVP